MNQENPNIAWAMHFVNELAQGGLTNVCIAPGSRSAPLTLAFHANKNIRVYQHLDERSAAFFALGLALATEKSRIAMSGEVDIGARIFRKLVVVQPQYGGAPADPVKKTES